MTPGVATPGRPPPDLVEWRPGAPVVLSLWKPGRPVELVWFCRPGEPLVGAVPEVADEEKETWMREDMEIRKQQNTREALCFLTNLPH